MKQLLKNLLHKLLPQEKVATVYKEVEVTTEVAVLTQVQYDKLQAVLPKPVVSGSTTDTQAAYLLGIQHALDVLRSGWVVK